MAIKLVVNDRIHKRTIEFFNEVKIGLKYDSVASTFAFAIDFDPNNQAHAELACVSHIHECALYYIHESGKQELLITGYMLSQGFKDNAKPQLVRIGGYSRPGALEDCDVPVSIPLEAVGLTLRQIVERIIKPFGFSFIITSPAANTIFTDPDAPNAPPPLLANPAKKSDTVIDKSTAPESKNIKSYLTELATQRNLILTHTADGNLLITNANTYGTPLFDIDVDAGTGPPYLEMDLVYNGQGLHSHITVIRQADDEGGNSAEYTISNPLVPIVYRPKVVTLTSGNDITIEEAARNELGKELKSITLVITMPKAAINERFIAPNNTLTIRNRKLFLYNKTRWFIESVDFDADEAKENIAITCVLPYVYNNATPVNPFVDPHKNLPRI